MKKAPLPESERFRRFQRVRINYSANAVIPYRYGYVEEDDGGPKVRVSWHAQDGPKIARNVVLYHGRKHVQMIPRERLEAAELHGGL